LLRTTARAAGAVWPLLLAAVVLAGVALAGRQYVYCKAMQDVMSHPCCTHGGGRSGPESPAAVVSATECCQTHGVPSLDPWTPVGRSIELTAPGVSVVSALPFRLLALTSAEGSAASSDLMRTGPPQSRVLARLMVFRI
jgi:hypothetical protein